MRRITSFEAYFLTRHRPKALYHGVEVSEVRILAAFEVSVGNVKQCRVFPEHCSIYSVAIPPKGK